MATDNHQLSFFTALRGIEQRLENRLQRVQTRVTTMGWGGTFRSALLSGIS